MENESRTWYLKGTDFGQSAQVTYYDEHEKKLVILETKDGGKTWVTIREYDSKNYRIIGDSQA